MRRFLPNEPVEGHHEPQAPPRLAVALSAGLILPRADEGDDKG
jgi:hypothetical protein